MLSVTNEVAQAQEKESRSAETVAETKGIQMFSAFFPAAVVLEFPNAAESEQERSGGRKEGTTQSFEGAGRLVERVRVRHSLLLLGRRIHVSLHYCISFYVSSCEKLLVCRISLLLVGLLFGCPSETSIKKKVPV